MLDIFNESEHPLEGLEELIQDLFSFSNERFGFKRPPSLFLKSDSENAKNALGRTGSYEPSEMKIMVFVDGRHPKDILRSIAHEFIHHLQNLRGDFDHEFDTAEGYAQNDPHLRGMEEEAYSAGNLCFRDWEDSRKQQLTESICYNNIIGGNDMSDNKRVSLKEWKNAELNSQLMKKFGLVKEESGAGAEQLYHEETTAESSNAEGDEESTDSKDGKDGKDKDDDDEPESTSASATLNEHKEVVAEDSARYRGGTKYTFKQEEAHGGKGGHFQQRVPEEFERCVIEKDEACLADLEASGDLYQWGNRQGQAAKKKKQFCMWGICIPLEEGAPSYPPIPPEKLKKALFEQAGYTGREDDEEDEGGYGYGSGGGGDFFSGDTADAPAQPPPVTTGRMPPGSWSEKPKWDDPVEPRQPRPPKRPWQKTGLWDLPGNLWDWGFGWRSKDPVRNVHVKQGTYPISFPERYSGEVGPDMHVINVKPGEYPYMYEKPHAYYGGEGQPHHLALEPGGQYFKGELDAVPAGLHYVPKYLVNTENEMKTYLAMMSRKQKGQRFPRNVAEANPVMYQMVTDPQSLAWLMTPQGIGGLGSGARIPPKLPYIDIPGAGRLYGRSGKPKPGVSTSAGPPKLPSDMPAGSKPIPRADGHGKPIELDPSDLKPWPEPPPPPGPIEQAAANLKHAKAEAAAGRGHRPQGGTGPTIQQTTAQRRVDLLETQRLSELGFWRRLGERITKLNIPAIIKDASGKAWDATKTGAGKTGAYINPWTAPGRIWRDRPRSLKQFLGSTGPRGTAANLIATAAASGATAEALYYWFGGDGPFLEHEEGKDYPSNAILQRDPKSGEVVSYYLTRDQLGGGYRSFFNRTPDPTKLVKVWTKIGKEASDLVEGLYAETYKKEFFAKVGESESSMEDYAELRTKQLEGFKELYEAGQVSKAVFEAKHKQILAEYKFVTKTWEKPRVDWQETSPDQKELVRIYLRTLMLEDYVKEYGPNAVPGVGEIYTFTKHEGQRVKIETSDDDGDSYGIKVIGVEDPDGDGPLTMESAQEKIKRSWVLAHIGGSTVGGGWSQGQHFRNKQTGDPGHPILYTPQNEREWRRGYFGDYLNPTARSGLRPPRSPAFMDKLTSQEKEERYATSDEVLFYNKAQELFRKPYNELDDGQKQAVFDAIEKQERAEVWE